MDKDKQKLQKSRGQKDSSTLKCNNTAQGLVLVLHQGWNSGQNWELDGNVDGLLKKK